MRAWHPVRVLLRNERRQLLRHPLRSILVALLVAVPVAAVVGGATLARITEPTAAERRSQSLGRADLRVEVADHDQRRAAIGVLPPEAPHQDLFIGRDRVTSGGLDLHAITYVAAPAAFADGGLAAGMLRFTTGRPPANPAEVALSPGLLAALSLAVGDTVTLTYGPRRLVVGLAVDPEDHGRPIVVRTPAAVEHGGRHLLLAALPPAAAAAAADSLRSLGLVATTAAEESGGDDSLTALVFAIGGIGFLEAALVIAATFAVSLRRRRYEIGLLGSTGASFGAITTSQLLATGALAVVGSGVGAAVGLGAAAALNPLLDGWNGRFNGPFEAPFAPILAAVVMGVLTALGGAAWPVRRAVQIPIRVALGARKPPTGRSLTWLLTGLGMITAALAMLLWVPRQHPVLGGLVVLGGPLLGLLGFGACSPWLLQGLARLATPLPLAWRLALRDAGRHRDRSGPVVTAILAGMAMSVTVAVLVASLEVALDARPQPLRRDQILVTGPAAADVARRLQTELAALAAAPLQAVYAGGEPVRVSGLPEGTPPSRQWVACGDEEFLRALGAEGASDALRAGRLVALTSAVDALPGADIALSLWRQGDEIGRLPLHAAPRTEVIDGPDFVLGAPAVMALGLEPGPPLNRSLVPWLVRLDGDITPDVLRQAQAVIAGTPGTSLDTWRQHRRPVQSFYHVVLGICVFTGLVIVALATALSAAESAGDARVLHSVGASPRLLRTQEAARAAYLAFLGCFLAVPAGMIPALALFALANIPLHFVMMPWRDVAITVFALPVLAFTGAWLFAGRQWPGWRRPGLPERSTALTLVLIAVSGIFSELRAQLPDDDPSRITWQPYRGEAFDGSPLDGELGRFRVPQRRGEEGDNWIELACVRYRTANPRPGPPIVFLAGGPGGSGVEFCGLVATHPQIRLLEHADVIGLDQRGTGLSSPNLMSEAMVTCVFPLDRPLTRADVIAAVRRAVTSSARIWQERGVDLAAYNPVESADDVEDLRRALGVPRIVTFGTSYGSHLALAHLRRHPQSVARAVLRKVEGPDDTFKLPRTTQQQLEQLHDEVAGLPGLRAEIPDLLGLVDRLHDQLAAATVPATAHAGTDSAATLVLGPYDLQVELARALATSGSRAAIPALLLRLARGDWAPLAGSALANRSLAMPLLPVLVDCASGATASRLTAIRREVDDPAYLLADALQAPLYPECCEGSGAADLGDEFRGPLTCDVPVLLVSGTLDARTPPTNAARLAAGLPRAVHVVVENAGHESRELMSEEFRDLLQAFLRGEPVTSCTISLPPVLIDLGPRTDNR